MYQQSTALLALTSHLNNQNLHQILNSLEIQVKNKIPTNTKEGILSELESIRPSYQFIYSGLPGTIPLEELFLRIKQASPNTKIILVVTDSDTSRILNYMLNNVDAIVSSESLLENLEFAIKQLKKGNMFICGKTVSELRCLLQQKNLEVKFDTGLLNLLTDREVEVLHSLTQGKNYKQISQQLFISESTVKTHINNIFTKLNVNDRTQAVLYALRHGIESLIKKPQIVQNLVNLSVEK